MKKYFLSLCLLCFGFTQQSIDNQRLFNPVTEDLQLFLPDDLQATLWAESPMFFNPTNMDTDAKGRIWITEAVNYRNFNNDSTKFLHHQKGDRIVILEDTDQDGKADKSTVFTEDKDLVSPLGIAVLGNKIVVSCSPNMIVYTDENGDDKPDKKDIFLTGFGGFDHDHSLHSVIAGPDGNWYFNVGNAGPHTVTDKSGWTLRSGSLYTGGTPYNLKNEGNRKSDDGKVWVGGLQLRIKPDGTGMRVMAHNFRNSFETCVDSYGNMWQNDNDDQVVACRVSWLMEGGNAGYFSQDGTRFWQADQRPGQDMFTAHWHQEDPGVMPAGDNTGAGSPTGIMLNEGDGLGKQYRGMLFSADAGRNVIFGYKPELKGSGFELRGHRTNFLTSVKEDDKGYVWNNEKFAEDLTKWFRPSDVMIGTDGAMYVADWYDAVVGGHQMKDGKGYGRIYRITPKNKKLTNPKIDVSNTAGQTEALKNPAVNVRNGAFEALKKQGSKAIKEVKELVTDENPYIQARAVWLLANLGEKGVKEVEKILFDTTSDEMLKVSAFRALRQIVPDVVMYAKVLEISSDFLKREFLTALRSNPTKNVKIPFLISESLLFKNDNWYASALSNVQQNEQDLIRFNYKYENVENIEKEVTDLFTNVIYSLHLIESIPAIKTSVNSSQFSEAQRKKLITALAFIKDKKAAEAMLKLSKSKIPDVAEQANYWLAFRQTNDWFDLLNWKKTGIDLKKEKKTAEMNSYRTKILDEHITFSDRENTAKKMVKDPIGGQMLIGLAAAGTLPEDLKPTIETLIFNNPDASVRVQASRYFKRSGADRVFDLQQITNLKPDALAGKSIFQNNCASCHKVGKTGAEIGPELTLINKKFDRLGLLDAIINPNAAIVFGYEPYLITTQDGETFYGFMVADGEKTVVIKDVAGQKHIIATKNIASKQKQEQSLMPDPISMGFSEKNLADLTEYLLSLK